MRGAPGGLGAVEAAWATFGIMFATAAGALALFLWRSRRRIRAIVGVLARPFTSTEILRAEIKEIAKELRTNGGTSLRDVINRLEEQGQETRALVVAGMDRDRHPLFQADGHGRYAWVNVAYLTLTGRQKADVLSYGWINVVHPADRERVRAQWFSAVKENRSFEEQYRVLGLDGELHRVVCYAYPTVVNGEVKGWIGHLEFAPSGEEPK